MTGRKREEKEVEHHARKEKIRHCTRFAKNFAFFLHFLCQDGEFNSPFSSGGCKNGHPKEKEEGGERDQLKSRAARFGVHGVFFLSPLLAAFKVFAVVFRFLRPVAR